MTDLAAFEFVRDALLAPKRRSAAQVRMAELGMRPGSPWCWFRTLEPIGADGALCLRFDWCAAPNDLFGKTFTYIIEEYKACAGYTLEGFGWLVDESADRGSIWEFELPPLRIQAWHCKAQLPNSPLFVVLQWRPSYSGPELLTGGGVATTAAEQRAVAQAVSLITNGLFRRAAGGRPKGSGTYTDGEALKAHLDPVVLKLRASRKWPSSSRVARQIGEQNTTVIRWVRDHLHLTWTEYLASLGITRS